MHPETLAIRSTMLEDHNFGAVVPPLYLTTTFERNPDGSVRPYVYSRAEAPNRHLLEKSLALLEGGAVAYAFASGQAATFAVLQALGAGTHVIAPDDAYYGSLVLMQDTLADWGLEVSRVNMTDPANVKRAIQPNTKLIWVETPSNPRLQVTDIAAMAQIAHEIGAICAVDNTWATPILQSPLALGADIVMHSTTKYLSGHSDVLGGALILREQGTWASKIHAIQKVGGAVPSPFDCWLVARGIRTLPLRVKAQTESAMKLATFLHEHPAIEVVHYPGLSSHPGHLVASQQMRLFGAMLSVQVKGGETEALAVTSRLKLFTHATSLGGVESLVEHRRSSEGPTSQSPANLLRISVGLEHIADLIEDWAQALL
ncbi:MAG: aminotransferase class V-fold PLP-dependent enzyme [Spirosomataceae bacterium]